MQILNFYWLRAYFKKIFIDFIGGFVKIHKSKKVTFSTIYNMYLTNRNVKIFFLITKYIQGIVSQENFFFNLLDVREAST
jgi:GTP-binding protein EngB required for normal cell division